MGTVFFFINKYSIGPWAKTKKSVGYRCWQHNRLSANYIFIVNKQPALQYCDFIQILFFNIIEDHIPHAALTESPLFFYLTLF